MRNREFSAPLMLLTFLDRATEAETIAQLQIVLETTPKKPTGGRTKIKRYGWSYEHPPKSIDMWPDWIEAIRVRLPVKCNYSECSVTINEYAKGAWIDPHIDSEDFGDTIQIVSLGAPAVMKFTCDGEESREEPLFPGSVLVLEGELRHKFKHQVLPVNATRYSIVFREKKT